MQIAVRRLFALFFIFIFINVAQAQNNLKLKFKNSTVYAGIEVGSKGVKMSLIEMGRNAKKNGNIHMLKDTAVNTDFINFNKSSFTGTLNAFSGLYLTALEKYAIPSQNIFTAISSGVKIQAEKEGKDQMISALIDSFRIKIGEKERTVTVIDVLEEARLSHLGIVPDSRRYSTFLIDIGSGNTKGGYFPNGNTKDLRLFQLSWGTKSISNETTKRLEEDKTLLNYSRQLHRVLAGPAESEIVYAVNVSGAYNMSDNIAVSGGIAWAVATLIYPELAENQVIPVTFSEVQEFTELIAKNPTRYSQAEIIRRIGEKGPDKELVKNQVKQVHKVFDQRALMAGSGLLLKIMRQFEGVKEKKQFYLVKNGAVGWISAFVNDNIE